MQDFNGGGEGSPRRLELSSEAEASSPRVLTVLSFVLERLMARNERLWSSEGVAGNGNGGKLTVFHGVRAPSISIGKYLERIYKYTNCSPSCFVVGYVYMDRVVHRHPESLILSLNIHRLLVTSVMVASKVLDDEHYNNAFYARVGGVSNAELNRLELELLFLLDFGLMVSSRVFESYCLHLEKEMMWGGNIAGQRIERSVATSIDDDTEITAVESLPSLPSQMIDE